MDLDLRKVRYFVAVAEELNFGRPAERLHIAQPVLSRQIRALENELHAQLFVRDSSGTQLTRAGTQLLADASLRLAGADAARRPGRPGDADVHGEDLDVIVEFRGDPTSYAFRHDELIAVAPPAKRQPAPSAPPGSEDFWLDVGIDPIRIITSAHLQTTS